MATPRARPTRSAAAAAASSTSLAGSRTSALSATSSSSGSRSPASTSNASGSLTRKAGIAAARSLMAPTASSAARATPARGGSGGTTAAATTAGRARKVQPNATPTAATVGKNKAVLPASQSSFSGESVDYEPIKVYLRVRPPTATSSDAAETNLSILSPTEVLMTPPTGLARHNQASPMKYTFTRVYAPSTLLSADSKPLAASSDSGTSQADFFRGTTLPLVEQLLQGSNGLVYTYGVTNSGKSYTILGQPGVGGAGILPRTLDVVFNSIQGLQSESNIRPVGFSGVELGSPESSASPAGTGINPYSRPTRGGGQWEREETTLAVDRNYRYSIWVSYVEVYNEKVYDLLDVPPAPAASLSAQLTGGRSGMTRSGSRMGSSFSIAGIAASGGPLFQRNSLKIATASESEGRGKYVANATEVKVSTAEEARALIQRGDENRQVFGTAANRVSSRSHGIFTIRLVREHGGAMGDVTYCSTARLSIVDLAGTERTANTGTTGDRFKEASSINQSLMVLGLCIDTLRQNQARAASRLIPTQKPISSLSKEADTAPTLLPLRKGRPLTVPFAQSMLTQLFANFFTGDGQAVMCANINPWDTGFDENAAVLKFSGRAQEVSTARAPPKTLTVSESLRKIWPPPATTTSGKMDEAAAATPRRGIPVSTTRNAASSKGAADARAGREAAEMLAAAQAAAHEITIIEVEEEDEEDDEENARDPVIPMLLQQFEEMRQRLYESELRCARIEAEVRVEMADEMAERLYEVERRYTERLQADTKHNEDFVNRKIDLLVRANNAGAEQRRTASGAGAGASMETPRRKQERKDAEEVEATLAVLAEEDSMLEDEDDEDEEEESQCEESEASVQLQAGPLDSSGILAKRLARMSVDGDVSAFSTSSDSVSEEAEEQDTPQISTRRSAEAGQEDESMREASDEEDAGTEREEAGEISIDVDDEEEEEGSQLSEESDEEEEEENEASSDASFDVTKEVDSSFEAPVAPRRSAASAVARKSAAKPVQARSSTKRAPAARSSTAVPLAEHSQSASASLGASSSYSSLQSSNSDEASDASLIHVPAKTPRKKRTLRKKAVDETTMLEQIGDSSLVEALQRSSSHSGSIARRGIR